MPIETIIVITCILTAFIGFALVLAWADRQTSDLHNKLERRAALLAVCVHCCREA
jgi:hypothetical protein